ncbi:hypothetical protein E2P81_ATG01669 [Venturia nashicola]|nr:hypothetical protein E2P81_ATG01669 [Venturia nashicola]
MASPSGRKRKAVRSIKDASISFDEFSANPGGIKSALDKGSKSREKHWTPQTLAYYQDEAAPVIAVVKTPDEKYVLMPRGAMPENVAYIWPGRAKMYCIMGLSLPAPHEDNLWMPHRKIVSLRNDGFMNKKISETVLEPAVKLSETESQGTDARTNNLKLANSFSERDQVYRVRLGVFGPVIRKQGCAKSREVLDILQYKSIGGLFHGIVGIIDPIRCKWSPPQDPTHSHPEANMYTEYDVPPPEDIPPYDREQIDMRRVERGLKPLPSFAEFLRRCPGTLIHYFPMAYAGLTKGFYTSEKLFLERVEMDRMETWKAIKHWSAEELASAMEHLAESELKLKKRVKHDRKRRRSTLGSHHGDNQFQSAKKTCDRSGSHGDEGLQGSNMIPAPRTPARQPSSGREVQAPDMGFTPSPSGHNHRRVSNLSQEWSPELADVQEQQASPYTTRNFGLDQFGHYTSSPVTTDHMLQDADVFQSPVHMRTPPSGVYWSSAERSRSIRRADSGDDLFSTMQNAPSGMTGGYGYGSMNPFAPPRYRPSNFHSTGATGDMFGSPLSHGQQHGWNQMQAPQISMGYIALPHFNPPILYHGPINAADLPIARGNYRQEGSMGMQLFQQPGLYYQGTQAPAYHNDLSHQGEFQPQFGYAANHSGNQQSTGTQQQEGSYNIVHQTQNNFMDPAQVDNSVRFPQDSALSNNDGEPAFDMDTWPLENFRDWHEADDGEV